MGYAGDKEIERQKRGKQINYLGCADIWPKQKSPALLLSFFFFKSGRQESTTAYFHLTT